ncbi:MAG: hypothetical protein PHF00_01245 [Elusimicrobia bacterium]|nr:hypothetical protein [Elusimicrobiota bacterium]
MTLNVNKCNDPFKKYWWVILLAFAGIGAWVCMPLMDTSVGAGSAGLERGLKPADQSLDSLSNPQGAPGAAVDLSMEGTYRKMTSDETGMTSSLYQAPSEAAAAGSPIATGAAPASFADALKEVARKKDPTGWGGAAVRKAFVPPKAGFGGLSGFGGGSGGGSGASLSAGAFGTANPKIGMAATRGLGSMEEGPSRGRGAVLNALHAAKNSGQSASLQQRGDSAKALSGLNFDGSRRGGSSISAEQAAAASGISLDDAGPAPINLKENDSSANSYKYEPVPKAVAPMDTSEEQKRQIVMAVAGAVIGGLIGGTAGNMIGMALMMAATMGRSQNSGSNVAGQLKGKTSFVPARRTYGQPAAQYS